MKFEAELVPLSIAIAPATIPDPVDTPGEQYEGLREHQEILEAFLMGGRLSEAYLGWSKYWETWLAKAAFPQGYNRAYLGRGAGQENKRVVPRHPRKAPTSQTEPT